MKYTTVRISGAQKERLNHLLVRLTTQLDRKVSLREVLDLVVNKGLDAFHAEFHAE